MKLSTLYTNDRVNPMGIGCRIHLRWCYTDARTRGEIQRSYRVQVRTTNGDLVHDSGIREGRTMQYRLTPADGIRPGTAYVWQVTAVTGTGEVLTSPEAGFETAIDNLSDAAWIRCDGEEPAAPVFSSTLDLPEAPVRARLYATGLGLIYPTVNGCACTDAFLQPANSPYDRLCYFETYDVTGLLFAGKNHVEIQAGGGYNGDYSQYGWRYFTPKGIRAMLVVTLPDGTEICKATDATWLWRDSEITANGLYAGETYDATRRVCESHPVVCDPDIAPKGVLTPTEMPPVRVIEAAAPVADWPSPDGTGVVYDFGKIRQGIVEIVVEAPAGCEIVLKHTEMIHPDGRIDPETNRNARAEDRYICRGEGREVWHPRFTYHGFRYVCVKGSDAAAHFEIKALYLSADVGEGAQYSCSEPIVNRIHSLAANSMRANFTTIPTDCPVRDERTPCQMDSQMYEDAAMYNFDMYGYYKKWLADITANPEGICRGNMDWSGDGLFLTYRLYRFYGDLDTAAELYPHLKKAMEIWRKNWHEGTWESGFGDWCLPNDNTWDSFHGCVMATNTSLLHAYTGMMTELAEKLGCPEDAAWFADMGRELREGYIRKYWHEDGSLHEGRQPEMLLPLFYGVLTGEKKRKSQDALLQKMASDGYLDTGGFATRCVLPVLAEIEAERPEAGAFDLLMQILRRNEYPGYGYLVSAGATTLWEQWANKGGMHSHSHAMHAGIDAALFATFCGVQPMENGFETFAVEPHLPGEIRHCGCRIHTWAGAIAVEIERICGGLSLTLDVPPNTTAVVKLPDFPGYDDCILLDGERLIPKTREMTLGGGRYHLRYVPKAPVADLYPAG